MIRPWHLRRLVRAARVWRRCRHLRVMGATYSQSCAALDDAVALFIGEPIMHPQVTQPPTPKEIFQSQQTNRRLRDRAGQEP